MDSIPNVKGFSHQLVAGCTASLSAFAAATVFGWFGPSLPRLLGPDSEIPMTSGEASWLVAMPDFGNVVSPIPAGILADHFGRKIVILSSGPLFLIGWAIILYFKTIWALIVARSIQGMGIGIVYAVLPMYLGEIAAPRYRGVVVSTFFSGWWCGYLFEYIVGPKLSFLNFTIVTAFTNVLFIVTFVWQPESPYYYFLKKDIYNAEKSLSWFLCSSQEHVNKELEIMKLSLERNGINKVRWIDLVVNPTNRKSMVIMLLIGFLRMCCGLTPLSSYSTETLTTAGVYSFLSPDNVTIAMGVMMLLGSFGSLVTLDLFGRTKLLLVSCLTSSISMFSVGTFFLLKCYYSVNLYYMNWIPSAGLIIFSATAVIGIFPVFTAYQSELFDTSTRATASSFMAIYTTVAGFIPLKYYLTISNMFGQFLNFYIFALVCLFGAVLSCTIMPETKGKSFEQIRQELQTKS